MADRARCPSTCMKPCSTTPGCGTSLERTGKQKPIGTSLDSVTTCDYTFTMKSAGKKRHTHAVHESPAVYSVREAKARFSEMLRLAEQGTEITITSHGQPKVCLTKAGGAPRPFRVAAHWLKTMKVVEPQTPAELIIRADRDARG